MGIKNTIRLMSFLILFPLSAAARPVSFPGGWMLMQANNGMENSASLSYSPTAYDAFGGQSEYFRTDGTWLHSVTYNRLLRRWNNPGSQANVYLLTGAGVGQDHGRKAPAAFGGIESDWESRRYYVSYENRGIASGANPQSFNQKTRVGIAPYLGGYGAVHSWVMVEVEHNPSADKNVIVTPLIRLFNTGLLTEIGYSSNKAVLFNATLQF